MSFERVEIGNAVLYRGDCLEVLPTLDAQSIDAVVADPPYGIGYVKSAGGRGLHSVRNHSRPIINDEATFDPSPWLRFPRVILWGADHWNTKPSGGTLLCWDKTDGGKGPRDSFADAEFAWCNLSVKRNVCRLMWKGICTIKAGEDMKTPRGGVRRVHPTQKPLRLMRWCLETLAVPESGCVLDGYMGSGTTGVACAQTGRRFVGVEIDQRYFDIACKRIEDAHAQRLPPRRHG